MYIILIVVGLDTREGVRAGFFFFIFGLFPLFIPLNLFTTATNWRSDCPTGNRIGQDCLFEWVAG